MSPTVRGLWGSFQAFTQTPAYVTTWTNDLSLRLKFDKVVQRTQDWSGNNNHGRIVDGTWSNYVWASGTTGGWSFVDAAGDFIQADADSSYAYMTNYGMISWVYYNGLGSYPRFWHNLAANKGFRMYINMPYSRHHGYQYFSGDDGSWRFDGAQLTNLAWQYVWNYDGSHTNNDPTFYMNKATIALTSEDSLPQGNFQPNDGTVAMTYGGEGAGRLDGILGEQFVFKRDVTGSEWTNNYDSGTTPSLTDCVLWWPNTNDPPDYFASEINSPQNDTDLGIASAREVTQYNDGTSTGSYIWCSADYTEGTNAPITAPPFTFACWANPDNVGNTARALIAEYKNASADEHLILGVKTNQVMVSTEADGGGGQEVLAGSFSAGTWMHVALSVDASTNAYLYKDGALLTNWSLAFAGIDELDACSVGAAAELVQGYNYYGYIDETCIATDNWSATEVLDCKNDTQR